MSNFGVHNLGGSYFKRAFLTAFIAFHGFAMACWALPMDVYPLRAVKRILNPYIIWFGLNQTWNMFSPDPPIANRYVKAEVTFKSGAVLNWNFPQMEKLGLFKRYSKERYRKFANDWVRDDKRALLWPDTARYIARSFNNPGDPPRTVKLIRYSAAIPLPNSTQTGPLWRSSSFFSYEVKPSDLR